jgi:hypothetical protein
VSRSLLIALLLAAAACAHQEPAPPASPGANVASTTAGALVDYLRQLEAMSPQARVTQATRAREVALRDGDAMARTRAALALSLESEPDDATILALLEPVAASEKEGAEVRAVASFLHTMASSRRRLRENAEAAGSRLREEHRAREAEHARAEAERQRATELQQKLDALSELEKTLSDQRSRSR